MKYVVAGTFRFVLAGLNVNPEENNSLHSKPLLIKKPAPNAKVVIRLARSPFFDPAFANDRPSTAVRLLVSNMIVLRKPRSILNTESTCGHVVPTFVLTNKYAPSNTLKKMTSDPRKTQTPNFSFGTWLKGQLSAPGSSSATKRSLP